jgi:hypothetical protein
VVAMTDDRFEVYDLDGRKKARHILFRRKQPWEPLKPLHRIKTAAKHLMRKRKH